MHPIPNPIITTDLNTPTPFLYLSQELAFTGAHKINNAVGQALLARRIGKKRIIAETGAGQHGVATATGERGRHSSLHSPRDERRLNPGWTRG